MACESYLNNAVIKKEYMQKRDSRDAEKWKTADLLQVGKWKVILFLSCCCFNDVWAIKYEKERA